MAASDEDVPAATGTGDVHPARYWRDVLQARSLRDHPPPPGGDPDEHFRRLMETTYADACRALQSQSERERAAAAVAVYVSGLALLTYGRLDVLPYVLTYVPPAPSPLHALASSIGALLPLPPWLSPRVDSAAVLAWLEAHWEVLRWSEEEGRFALVE